MKCKNCEQKDADKYSRYTSGEFCSKECARVYSTKNKRKEINEKVSNKLTGSGNDSVEIKCDYCKKKFEVEWKRRGQKFCSKDCQKVGKEFTEESRKKLSEHSKKRCSTIEGRKRMRDIGRKGGFGKKGYTKGGTRYQSLLEKKCFEFLEKENIDFIPHRNIPNSSKVSDVYLVKKNIWIEIDGIDREKRQKWLEEEYKYWISKLEIYKIEKLNFLVVKNLSELKEVFKPNY